MKALVYHGPGKKPWEVKPKPAIMDPTDALLKIQKTTICGTDLHIMKGDVPTVINGRVLGHEGLSGWLYCLRPNSIHLLKLL
jgi:alcohol dehydrogenase